MVKKLILSLAMIFGVFLAVPATSTPSHAGISISVGNGHFSFHHGKRRYYKPHYYHRKHYRKRYYGHHYHKPYSGHYKRKRYYKYHRRHKHYRSFYFHIR